MIPDLPEHQIINCEPIAAEIYQLDSSPLADRKPLLLVHGSMNEKLKLFRWQHLCKYLNKNESFRQHYKIYLARYCTSSCEKELSQTFKPALKQLAHETGRPMTVVALSIGGNIVRDAMGDPAVDKSITKLITLGSPFHGSPLFSEDWMQYSIFKHYKWPHSCIDRSISYSFYFNLHPNLVEDFYWDDCDRQVPSVGQFKFSFPLKMEGNLLPPASRPPGESISAGSNKLIAYAGYIQSRFIPNHRLKGAKVFLSRIVSFFHTTIPAHLGHQRAVLRGLNSELAYMQTAGKEPTPYALNDGVTTVASGLSLPRGPAIDISSDDDKSMALIKSQVNIKKARLFQNIDHATYLDNRLPLSATNEVVDRLSPNEKPRSMFAWLLRDITD